MKKTILCLLMSMNIASLRQGDYRAHRLIRQGELSRLTLRISKRRPGSTGLNIRGRILCWANGTRSSSEPEPDGTDQDCNEGPADEEAVDVFFVGRSLFEASGEIGKQKAGAGGGGAFDRFSEAGEEGVESGSGLRAGGVADYDQCGNAGDEGDGEGVGVPVVETLAAGCHEGEVHHERNKETGDRAPTISSSPENATEDADAHVSGHSFCEQERVEYAIYQEESVEDTEQGEDEATDAAGPEVVCIGSFAAEEALVKVFGEECAGVDHEGRAGAHVRSEDTGEHEAEPAGEEEVAAGETEGVFGVVKAAKAGVGIESERRNHKTDQGPADGADAFDEVAIEHAVAAGAFVFTGADGGELVGLGNDSDQAVEREQKNEPDADAVGGGKREKVWGECLFHPGEAANLAPAQGDQHKREGDDEEALEEVCPGAGQQTADEAVEQKDDRHPEDNRVGGDRAARGLADHFACTFEHRGHVDREVNEGESGVDDAHPGAVAVFDNFADGRAAHAAKERGDEPVERRGEEVLPLKPDAGEAAGVDGTGEGNGHFRMGANAEALADHEPAIEAPIAEEVALCAPDVAPCNYADGGDNNEVADEDDPVDDVQLKTHVEDCIVSQEEAS